MCCPGVSAFPDNAGGCSRCGGCGHGGGRGLSLCSGDIVLCDPGDGGCAGG